MRDLCRGFLWLFLVLGLFGCGGLQDTSVVTPVTQAPVPQERPLKIGVILPLSGPHKTLGSSVQKAIELLYLNQGASSKATVHFSDSTGTPEGARRAMDKLRRQGVQVVIGPIFAAEVRALRTAPSSRAIPVLSLSNDRSVAGGAFFTLGLSPIDKIDALFVVAQQRGIQRIAVLAPRSSFGTQMLRVMEKQRSAHGIILAPSVSYGPENPYEVGTPPFNGADGLLIIEGPPNGPKILDSFHHSDHDVSHLTLMGLGAWIKAYPLGKATLYTKDTQGDYQRFFNMYQDFYGEKPHPLTLVAHDAFSLILSLSKERNGENLAPQDFQRPQGFQGIQGFFTFDPRGFAKRRIEVDAQSNPIFFRKTDD